MSVLDLNIHSESNELLFQASSTDLYLDAVVSNFAYQRLQMSVRDKCKKSELWYQEIMKCVGFAPPL